MMPEEESAGSGKATANNGDPMLDEIPHRLKLSELNVDSLSKDDLLQKWLTLEKYVDHIETRKSSMEAELGTLKLNEERLRQQNTELNQRERILIRRIAGKDQELQDCMNQIAELKAGQAPGATALRSALLDPAVNLLLHRLRQEVTILKTKLEETQNELSAWKFTPDSNTGKRLMAKCRLLYQENEELGRVVSSGRLAKLEGDLALQKSFSEEVKKSQSELDEFLQDLDEDVEGMQSTIYILQQELRKSKDTIAELQNEKSQTPFVKKEDERTEDESCEFRTGQLTNGDHSEQTQTKLECCGGDRTKEEENTSDVVLYKVHSNDLREEINKVDRGKRNFHSANSDDNCNLPLVKKSRRGSELSLDYNEEELGLTNGDAKLEDN